MFFQSLLTAELPYGSLPLLGILREIQKGNLPQLPPSVTLVEDQYIVRLRDIFQQCWWADPSERLKMAVVVSLLRADERLQKGCLFIMKR